MTYQPRFAFTPAEDRASTVAPPEVLELDLDGYEGPLHVLLELARRQRIDLREISISELADQYLAFVRDVRRIRLEPAADHLVMAAWLAELKSRLLLPKPERAESDPPDEEEAAQLARRLARLEAIRLLADALVRRPRLGRDVFGRGDPTPLAGPRRSTAGDLRRVVRSYPTRASKAATDRYAPQRRIEALPLAVARAHLEALLPRLVDWTELEIAAPRPPLHGGSTRGSRLASTLAASLELVREGRLRLRQVAPTAAVYLRVGGDRSGAVA